jgi:hypothetical protein
LEQEFFWLARPKKAAKFGQFIRYKALFGWQYLKYSKIRPLFRVKGSFGWHYLKNSKIRQFFWSSIPKKQQNYATFLGTRLFRSAIPKNTAKLGHFLRYKDLFGRQYLRKQQN